MWQVPFWNCISNDDRLRDKFTAKVPGTRTVRLNRHEELFLVGLSSLFRTEKLKINVMDIFSDSFKYDNWFDFN